MCVVTWLAGQARQELQLSGLEALAKASLELKVNSVDKAGHLHGIEFQVDRSEQCGPSMHVKLGMLQRLRIHRVVQHRQSSCLGSCVCLLGIAAA